MESNDNITRLLEMLDHPEAYSEQEIRDILISNDETREAYRLIVAVRQAYAHQAASQPADTEAAWQRFTAKHLNAQPLHTPVGAGLGAGPVIFKILGRAKRQSRAAASFIGIILVSGITFAAIHIARQSQHPQALQPTDTTAVANVQRTTFNVQLAADSAAVQPVVFDNIPLSQMLPEIAAHYTVEVRFQSEEVRSLRFHFVWNPQQEIEKVVADLNHFERLHVTLKDHLLTVE